MIPRINTHLPRSSIIPALFTAILLVLPGLLQGDSAGGVKTASGDDRPDDIAEKSGGSLHPAPGPCSEDRWFTDDLGRRIHIPDVPDRVVSLAPNVTEILFSLGVREKIAGATVYCDHPEEARNLPRMGDFSHPSLEKIARAAPDLVILTSLEQEGMIADLENLGLACFVIYPADLDALMARIATLGAIMGQSRSVEELLDSMKSRLAAVARGYAHIPVGHRPSVFCEVTANPLMTVSDESFVSSVIEAAGGRNVMEGLPRSYCRISPEKVIEKNPDVILAVHRGVTIDELTGRIGWDTIAAVKEKRVITDIDPDLLVRPGPRIVEGIAALSSRLYPASRPLQ